jgi:hypothetical protein
MKLKLLYITLLAVRNLQAQDTTKKLVKVSRGRGYLLQSLPTKETLP